MSVESGSERVAVYAIVRLDDYLGPETSLQGRVTVKEILPSLEEAEREVARLNALAEGREVSYFWQYTRFFPEGRGIRAASSTARRDEGESGLDRSG